MHGNLFFYESITSPLEEIKDPTLKKYGVSLTLKRDDLIHPEVSGNKWRKLKYNILEAVTSNKSTILSFGGAFSNHIYALAAAGHLAKINTIGIIRGEETLPLNSTLSFAKSKGMQIIYESRSNYRLKEETIYLENLRKQFGDIVILPEGGTNNLAVKGCEEIVKEIDIEYDVICVPCGSGGTAAGIIASAEKGKKVIGFSALKGEGIHEVKILELLKANKIKCEWEINYQYHFGGYSKINKELVAFINRFKNETGIILDPVYTGKMMFGIYDLIIKGYFKKGERIIALHTGGLQGIEGLQKKIDNFLKNN